MAEQANSGQRPQSTPTPSAFDYARMSPDERAENTKQRAEEYADRYLGPAGARAVDRSAAGAAAQGEDQSAQPPLNPAQRLAADTGEKIKIGEDLALSEAEIRAAVTAKAETDSRRLTLPQNSNDYRLELPKDLQLPGDVKFEFAENDPIKKPAIDSVRAFALKSGLDQTQFSELLGIYAASQAHEIAKFNELAAVERQKLGAAGTARVDAVARWLRAQFGDARVRSTLAALATEAQVSVFEGIIQKFVSQGSAPNNQNGRDADTGKVDDATYNSWSPAQRINYARRGDPNRY
jgi:hypothetical protein